MNQLSELSKIVKEIAGKEFLYFESQVQVKMSPHTLPLNIWAICVEPKGTIYIMDSNEEWHLLEEKETALTASLFQRVKLLSEQYSKAS